MMQFTPEEEADFGSLSDHDFMDPVEQKMVGHLEAIGQALAQQAQALSQLTQSLASLAEAMQRPKKVARGPDGRVIGIE